MLLTQSILISSAILLPGFVFYAYLFAYTENVAELSYKTDKVISTVTIGIGTILSHLTFCGLIWLNSIIVSHSLIRFPIDVNPDFYRASLIGENVDFKIIGGLLLALIALCCIAFILACVFKNIRLFREKILNYSLGPFYGLYEETKPVNSMAMAYVVTRSSRDTPRYKQSLGYVGILQNLVHNGKEIEAIHLFKATPFYTKFTANDFSAEQIHRSGGGAMEMLVIQREEIANIAFRILKVEDI